MDETYVGRKTWKFAVVGCDSNDCPSYLGFLNSLEEARKFQNNAEIVGWRRVAVFDAALNEVKDSRVKGSAA